MSHSQFIERVREAVNIIDLIPEAGGNGSGKSRIEICCPLPGHTEREPSFTLYTDQNSFHCFGCHKGGSVFDFLMARDGYDFWEAVLYLADRYNIPQPNLSDEERAKITEAVETEELLTLFCIKSHNNLLKPENQDMLDYLHTRGFTDESIKEYQIGLAIPITNKKNPVPFYLAGLLAKNRNGKEYQVMWGNTTPRITFPIKRNGRIINISGRETDGAEPKYMLLNGSKVFPFNLQMLRRPECILVEGIPDAILLCQAGFNACATIGTSFQTSWLKHTNDKTKYYACYDGDKPGQNANLKIGGTLHDSHRQVSIITMPDEQDPADFIKNHKPGEFQDLRDAAEPYVDYLVHQLPLAAEVSAFDMDQKLNGIFVKMKEFSSTGHDRYVDIISKQIGIGKVAVRKSLADFLRVEKKRPDANGEDADKWTIKKRQTDPIFFNAGQDVIDGTLYYVIYFEVEGGEFKPFVITSNKECFPYSKELLMQRNLLCQASAKPSNYNRWSIGTDNKNNVHDYLDGKSHIDPKELYAEIKWFFEHFVRLPDALYYDFLTCWAMATYHFRLYDSFGYTYLHAMKRSGKTQTLTLLSQFAFNASMSDALTEAVLKRRVNIDAATIIADEAEFFQHKIKDEKSMVFEVFNGGYKRTGRASMVDPDTKMVEDFCTFSPKALANTQGLTDVLVDRCISLDLLHVEENVPQFVEAFYADRLQAIRNKLYCFALEYIDSLLETKKVLKHPDNLPGRDWELWHPVLNMAAFLDNYQVVESIEYMDADDNVQNFQTLYDRMAWMAVERRTYKASVDEEQNSDQLQMIAIWHYMEEHPASKSDPAVKDLYSTGGMAASIKAELGWERYTARNLGRFAHETTKISRRSEKILYVDTVDGKRVRAIKIVRAKMIDRAKQLFSLDLENFESEEPKEPVDNVDWNAE